MGLEQKTVSLSFGDVMIQQLGTSKAIKYSVAMSKVVGGMAHGVKTMGETNVLNWDVDVGKVVTGLVEQLDQDATPALLKSLVRDSLIQPQWNDTWFEATFSGSLDQLVELIKAILEFNYGGLVEHLRKKIPGTSASSLGQAETTEAAEPASTPS